MQKVATVFPRSMLFLGVVHDPLFHQIHEAIAQKLGVNPEMFFCLQGSKRSR